jgi:hypothetical protein
MSLQTTIGNARSVATIVRGDVRESLRARRRPPAVQLDPRQRQALENLKTDGYAVVGDYCPRETAFELRDRLEAYLAEGKNRDFAEGAWLRFWDDRDYDQGVRRIYHVERLIPVLREVRHNPFVLDIVHAYYGTPYHSNALVFQHNTRTNEETRYYHVDAFLREFKAFLYLDDVDGGNGPFTYLRGTQRMHFTRLKKQVLGNEDGVPPTTFYPEDIKSVLDREVQINGPAGTLILADVRGLHRGSPQVDRSRSVLVNYILKHPGDIEIDK